MDIYNRYATVTSNEIIVKGRCSASLTTLTDLDGANILTDQTSLLLTPTTLDISSSSTADAAAGIGAQTLELIGLGANKTFIKEVVTLNGQTVVTTANAYFRLFFAQVLTTGTAVTGNNNGDIYIIKTGTGGTYTTGVPGTFTIASAIMKILATTNQGGSCFYTTPNIDKTSWIVKRIDVSSNLSAGTAVLQIMDGAGVAPYFRELYIQFGAGLPTTVDLTPYQLEYTKLTDIRLLALTASAGSQVGGSIYIHRNNLGNA